MRGCGGATIQNSLPRRGRRRYCSRPGSRHPQRRRQKGHLRTCSEDDPSRPHRTDRRQVTHAAGSAAGWDLRRLLEYRNKRNYAPPPLLSLPGGFGRKGAECHNLIPEMSPLLSLPENPVMSCSYLRWCTLKWNSPPHGFTVVIYLKPSFSTLKMTADFTGSPLLSKDMFPVTPLKFLRSVRTFITSSGVAFFALSSDWR